MATANLKQWIADYIRLSQELCKVTPSGGQIKKIKKTRIWLRYTPEAFINEIANRMKEAENGKA